MIKNQSIMENKTTFTEEEFQEYLTNLIFNEPIFTVADLMSMGVISINRLKKAFK